jgi:hypothetical protein
MREGERQETRGEGLVCAGVEGSLGSGCFVSTTSPALASSTPGTFHQRR